MSEHAREVDAGLRFRFGDNWGAFLAVLDDERIAEAERSLVDMLGRPRLDGARVIDVGSGSGLFSLAAHRLGAEVTSFDFDPRSVACTAELRRRYATGSARWQVHEGSILDRAFVDSLGTFDLVYSWGVLHHTGRMWEAIERAAALVAPGGQLFIALYNDQGRTSHAWRKVKETYNGSRVGRAAVLGALVPYFVGRAAAADLVRGKNPLVRHRAYRQRRGMSMMHDIVDWLGGLPFEVAAPGAVVDFLRARGFTLERLRTVGGAHGCNEFVARRA
jgi:2-polyprenyl-6-hydroxyphenyl methylase/3-demethylubiquinone-9 3-methyltransferase